MEDCGYEVIQGHLDSNILLPNSKSCQRDVLIDFTLKNPSVGFLSGSGSTHEVTSKLHQTINSVNEPEQPDSVKDIRHQLIIGNYLRKTEKRNIETPDDFQAYCHKDKLLKVDSSDREALKHKQVPQMNSCERDLILDENQVKEIVSALIFRKDIRFGKMHSKESVDSSNFDFVDRSAFSNDLPMDDIERCMDMEQMSVNFGRRNHDTSTSFSSGSADLNKFGMKNTKQFLPEEQAFSYFPREQVHFNDKAELPSFINKNGSMRNKSKPSSFGNHVEQFRVKRNSPVISAADHSQIRDSAFPLNFDQEIGKNLSPFINNSELNQSISNSVLHFADQKYSPIKSSVSTYNKNQEQHVKMENSFVPVDPGHRTGLYSNNPSPLIISSEQLLNFKSSHLAFTPKEIDIPVNQDLNFSKKIESDKNDPALSYIQKISMDNIKSYAMQQEQKRIKKPAPLASEPNLYELTNAFIHSFNQDHVKMNPTLATSALSENRLNKNSTTPFFDVQLELSLKNENMLSGNSARYFTGNIERAPLSNSASSVIRNPTVSRGALTPLSNDKIDVKMQNSVKNIALCQSLSLLKDNCHLPLSEVIQENVRHKSLSSSDTSRNLDEQKNVQGTSSMNHGDSLNDVRLRSVIFPDLYSIQDHIASQLAGDNHQNGMANPQTTLTTLSPVGVDIKTDLTKEIINQRSVIAQGETLCKVCSVCRKFFSENGFLKKEDSCHLCMYHAKEAMKCVCHHTEIKEESCKCLLKNFKCAFCSESCSTILQLHKHTFSHVSPNLLGTDNAEEARNSENKEDHKCYVCKATFPSVQILDIHMESHIDNYCKTCKRIFQNFNRAKHSCEARFTCNLCGSGFATNYNLKMHILKHSGNLPYKCMKCNKSFMKPSELSKHSLVHSGERPYLCGECNMSFTNPSNLRNHVNTHSGLKLHSCEVCHKNFTRPADVKRHMLIHTGVKPHSCTVCGLAFADSSNLKKHIHTHSKSHLGPDIKSYHCIYCGKMFARPSELKRHFFTHTNTRPYSCHICGLAFTDSSNLKKHILTHERSTVHTCLQCNGDFRSFNELEDHVSSTHGSKRFDPAVGHLCQKCGAAFTQLVDLQDHILSHGACPTFRCEICFKTFCEQIFLERHLLTHTESRPYTCSYSYCFKSFKSLSHLRSHMLIHTGEKTHVCVTCKKSFLKKSSLLRHQGIHDREKGVITF